MRKPAPKVILMLGFLASCSRPDTPALSDSVVAAARSYEIPDVGRSELLARAAEIAARGLGAEEQIRAIKVYVGAVTHGRDLLAHARILHPAPPLSDAVADAVLAGIGDEEISQILKTSRPNEAIGILDRIGGLVVGGTPSEVAAEIVLAESGHPMSRQAVQEPAADTGKVKKTSSHPK